MVTVGKLGAKALVETMAAALLEVKAQALLHCLGDTVADAEAETLYKTLSNIKA